MKPIFNTVDERNEYAAKCIQAGMDPERVADTLGYSHSPPSKQPIPLAEQNRRRKVEATIRAVDAARYRRKGWPDDAIARKCGYSTVSGMRKAIAHYIKSPAPTGIGNGADQNYHDQNTTKEACCQC